MHHLTGLHYQDPDPPFARFDLSQKNLPIGRIPPFPDKSEKNHCQRILDLENTVLGPFLTPFPRVRLRKILLKVFATLPLSSGSWYHPGAVVVVRLMEN